MGIKKVGVWLRVSTIEQAEGNSPQHHKARAQKFADFKEWDIVEVYNLSGVSGKSVMQHPECRRMLNDIKRGHIEALIFSKLGRLARNVRELLDFCDIFREYNADLISLSENIDTSTPAGRMFYTLLSATAEFERETIAERVRASVPIRAELGKSLGGQAPYGYQWVDKKLEIDENEAPIRKLMFELFLQYKRKRKVCTILNERGYRTRRGSKFSNTTLERLLTDPVAKGLKRSNYTRSLGDKKHWELKPQDDWVMQEAPSIVSEELWNSVNTILSDQKKGQKPRRSSVHLFTGLTICMCGEKMYIPSRSHKYTCRACKNKIPVDDLEMIFVEHLKQQVLDPHFATSLVDEGQQKLKDQEQLLDNLLKELDKTQKRLEQLLDLQASGELPKSGFKNHYEPVHEQHEQLHEQIHVLEASIKELKASEDMSQRALIDTQHMCEQWSQYSRIEKRSLIDLLVERIEVKEGEVKFVLKGLARNKNGTGTPSSSNELNGMPNPTKPKTNSFEFFTQIDRTVKDSCWQIT